MLAAASAERAVSGRVGVWVGGEEMEMWGEERLAERGVGREREVVAVCVEVPWRG